MSRRAHVPRSARGPARELDAACPACGYNVRGVPRNLPCPECGHDVGNFGLREAYEPTGLWARVIEFLMPAPAPGTDRSLIDAPLSYLHRLSRGARIMQWGLLAVLALLIGGVVAGRARPPFWCWWLAGSIVPAMLWAVGAWIIVAPRTVGRGAVVITKDSEWRTSRTVARVSQTFWVPAALLGAGGAIAHWRGGAMSLPYLGWLGQPFVMPVALGVLAFIGLTALGIYAANLADWAMDTSLADRLRVATLGIFAAPPVLILSGFVAASFGSAGARTIAVGIAFLACIPPLAWLAQMIVATVQFISLSTWAETNADAILHRDLRSIERAQERQRRQDEALAKPPVELSPPPGATRKLGTHVIVAASAGDAPIDLAPDSANPAQPPAVRHEKGR
ncbi:MAG TPA: hypothetical protein VD971_08500 [Phycisphaerales bacterium]|nr:hypothetical protein [Phycisphaerales bacterium]